MELTAFIGLTEALREALLEARRFEALWEEACTLNTRVNGMLDSANQELEELRKVGDRAQPDKETTEVEMWNTLRRRITDLEEMAGRRLREMHERISRLESAVSVIPVKKE